MSNLHPFKIVALDVTEDFLCDPDTHYVVINNSGSPKKALLPDPTKCGGAVVEMSYDQLAARDAVGNSTIVAFYDITGTTALYGGNVIIRSNKSSIPIRSVRVYSNGSRWCTQ